MSSAILQVVAAIALVIILFVIGFAIYNREAVRLMAQSVSNRRNTPIFNGIMDFKGMSLEYDTLDIASPNYRNLTPSVNQAGGAEFTYNFWMYITPGAAGSQASNAATQLVDTGLNPGNTPSAVKDSMILFMRGDSRVFQYKNICGTLKKDVMIKCPAVKLMNGGDALTVEFNTMQGVDAVREQARNTCSEISTDWNVMNSHRIGVRGLTSQPNLLGKWFMVTVVLQDTTPTDPIPIRNKVRVRIYVNGILELDRYADGKLGLPASLIRQNTGNFYVHPKNFDDTTDKNMDVTAARKLLMADLNYYNYAISSDEIAALLRTGFTKQFFAGCSGTMSTSDKDLMERMSIPNPEKKPCLIAI